MNTQFSRNTLNNQINRNNQVNRNSRSNQNTPMFSGMRGNGLFLMREHFDNDNSSGAETTNVDNANDVSMDDNVDNTTEDTFMIDNDVTDRGTDTFMRDGNVSTDIPVDFQEPEKEFEEANKTTVLNNSFQNTVDSSIEKMKRFFGTR